MHIIFVQRLPDLIQGRIRFRLSFNMSGILHDLPGHANSHRSFHSETQHLQSVTIISRQAGRQGGHIGKNESLLSNVPEVSRSTGSSHVSWQQKASETMQAFQYWQRRMTILTQTVATNTAVSCYRKRSVNVCVRTPTLYALTVMLSQHIYL